MITKTLNMSHVKYKLSTLQPIFIHKNISKVHWENDYHTILNGGWGIEVIIYIYGAISIFLLIYDDQDTVSE